MKNCYSVYGGDIEPDLNSIKDTEPHEPWKTRSVDLTTCMQPCKLIQKGRRSIKDLQEL